MAEEKPHEASPSKLRKARAEGNVARSGELNGAFSFLTASFTVLAIVPFMLPLFMDWFRDAAFGVPLQGMFLIRLGVMVAIPMIASGMTGAFVGIMQTEGPTFKPLKLDLKKLMPFEGIKKMFGKESAVNATRAFLSACIAIAAIRPVFYDVFSRGITNSDPIALALIVKDAIVRICSILFGVGLVFGFADFILTRSRWKHGLRMTHDEVKRDYKENNGDPHHIVLSVEPQLTKPSGETFEIKANSSDAAIITAKIVDAEGNWNPLADQNIRFKVSGPGVYRGSYNFYVTSGQPLAYHAPGDLELKAEGGLMRVSVRSTLQPGNVQVSAEADGLVSGSTSFETKALVPT